MALDEVVSLCEPTQVRHVMSVIEPQFQRDFIYLLPKEVGRLSQTVSNGQQLISVTYGNMLVL